MTMAPRFPNQQHGDARRALCVYFGAPNYQAALECAYRSYRRTGARPLEAWELEQIEADARRCSLTRAGFPVYVEPALECIALANRQ